MKEIQNLFTENFCLTKFIKIAAENWTWCLEKFLFQNYGTKTVQNQGNHKLFGKERTFPFLVLIIRGTPCQWCLITLDSEVCLIAHGEQNIDMITVKSNLFTCASEGHHLFPQPGGEGPKPFFEVGGIRLSHQALSVTLSGGAVTDCAWKPICGRWWNKGCEVWERAGTLLDVSCWWLPFVIWYIYIYIGILK